ncbi:hypothetical protein PHYBLDRAFT_71690 [Phycomyces blakesleeanus NRRL 1555(-)]|uniref:DDE Tnp4 domain-containing protein n=1 Tax=Phycomyces blakesleeanus (strain ATCC 8743b / DSM 1359 / FGSC 10004 / NBRC 33097 / NRRL 1555) TaxID=763407 RepID=A0A163CV20_PHYB8|nr:hypothetical protein PHYBLDRAFT_71690 [Phycomyces blakesleeanus NRRL 1555(-)]OAD65790.1 hypothetical protein PHYBLDRAFT_71690 [Phycomyces blakesleeanus NRRL 1555(-)]|eukprot:XP_018283830.1 hypothetical protein PHYBLDRAFT_71690 [Phycomyces blakesleeanus NRRL 1555(-)]
MNNNLITAFFEEEERDEELRTTVSSFLLDKLTHDYSDYDIEKISQRTICQLAYGLPANSIDESFRMTESTAFECLKHFCAAVVSVFGNEYLRAPYEEDNCPTAWHRQYVRKEKTPTIVLEAVASYDLWIGHIFFGLPGSLNDSNVLDWSHLFENITDGKGPKGYYLTDDIYPTYAAFVKSFNDLQSAKHKNFAKAQETVRKDVECAFENDRGEKENIGEGNGVERKVVGERSEVDTSLTGTMSLMPRSEIMLPDGSFASFMQRFIAIQNCKQHFQLRHDLVESLWQRKGDFLIE